MIFTRLRTQLGWTLFLPKYVLTSIWLESIIPLGRSCYSIRVVGAFCDFLVISVDFMI